LTHIYKNMWKEFYKQPVYYSAKQKYKHP